jgi:hypothetical protein
MVDGITCISDGEKDILERAINDPGARRTLVERYEKILFGFVLSFASFSREQAFEITVSSLTQTLKQTRHIPRDGVFLEALFRRALKEFEGTIPAGSADLSAIGNFPEHKRESLKIIRQALASLSPEDKTVLLLRDQCHFSFERIAGILGVGPRKAKSVCLAARERLRGVVQAILEKKDGVV